MTHTGGHPCISLLIIVLGLPENNNKARLSILILNKTYPTKRKYN
jgi:hypothetical protein